MPSGSPPRGRPSATAAWVSASLNPATRPSSRKGGSAYRGGFHRAISANAGSARTRNCSITSGAPRSVSVSSARTASTRSLSTTEFSSSRNQVGDDLMPRDRERIQRPHRVHPHRLVRVLHRRLKSLTTSCFFGAYPMTAAAIARRSASAEPRSTARSSSRCSAAKVTKRSWYARAWVSLHQRVSRGEILAASPRLAARWTASETGGTLDQLLRQRGIARPEPTKRRVRRAFLLDPDEQDDVRPWQQTASTRAARPPGRSAIWSCNRPWKRESGPPTSELTAASRTSAPSRGSAARQHSIVAHHAAACAQARRGEEPSRNRVTTQRRDDAQTVPGAEFPSLDTETQGPGEELSY